MRIDEIRELIDQEIGDLDVEVTQVPSDASNLKISGHRKAVAAARALEVTGAFPKEIEALVGDENLSGSVDPIVAQKDVAQRFAVKVRNLKGAAACVHRSLHALMLDTSETQVVIRLPHNGELSALVKDLSDLERLLSQAILNDFVKGAVRVAGFDRGSEWLILDLASIPAVVMLGMMYKYLLWSREKEQDIQIKRAWAESIGIDNEAKRKIYQALDSQLKAHERETLELVLRAGGIPTSENELSQRVLNSVKSLEKLVKKGMKIGLVTTSPRDVKELFAGAESFSDARKQLEAGIEPDEGEESDNDGGESDLETEG